MSEAHSGSVLEGWEWVAIVANPYSGSRRNPALVEDLTAALRRRGLRARPIWSPDELDAIHREPGGWTGCRCLVAAGGDGTVAKAINMRVPLPLAVLPLGNENLFARAFGFTLDAEALAARIATGHTADIDLGWCEGQAGGPIGGSTGGAIGGQYFSTVASAGFDAEVIHRVDRWRQRRKGLKRVRRVSYLRPILSGVLGYRYPPMELTTDDGQRARGVLALVANLPQYAMDLNPCPAACGTDGLLDWVVFERPGLLRLGLYGLAALRGRHLSRADVHHGRARRIELRAASAHPLPMEIDGEAAGEIAGAVAGEVSGHGMGKVAGFEAHAGAQRIIAPAEGTPEQ